MAEDRDNKKYRAAQYQKQIEQQNPQAEAYGFDTAYLTGANDQEEIDKKTMKPHWINCFDRLPVPNVFVLVYDSMYGKCCDSLNKNGKWYSEVSRGPSETTVHMITHWMPLPPDPVEDDTENVDHSINKYKIQKLFLDQYLQKRKQIMSSCNYTYDKSITEIQNDFNFIKFIDDTNSWVKLNTLI